MNTFTLIFHIVCFAMFGVGAAVSQGERNWGAHMATAGLVILALGYTGFVGSALYAFAKKKKG